MARVVSELQEQVLAYWRGHSAAWKLSGLTQKQYCALHNISLKNFGNWRAQLKRIALAGPRARWGHYPRLRKTPAAVSPRANPRVRPRANPKLTVPVAVAVPPPGRRREFSEELKQRIVDEASRPGASASEVARRYGLDVRLLRRWRKTCELAQAPAQTAGAQP